MVSVSILHKTNGAALDCLENATGGHFRIVCRKSVSMPKHRERIMPSDDGGKSIIPGALIDDDESDILELLELTLVWTVWTWSTP